MPRSPADQIEFRRGLNEARTQFQLVQAKWPKGFPVDPKRVRPLFIGTVSVIAGEMGWSLHYTRGVLFGWKQRTAYCNAVLRYDKRFHLDGTVSAEEIDAEARASATAALGRLAAKRAKAKTQGQTVTPPAGTGAGHSAAPTV